MESSVILPKALAAAQRMSGFIAGLLGGPMEEAAGILQDRLQLSRWERQNRLIDRYEEIVATRSLRERRVAVPPKFALPILASACLEDNDTLQDMWAELLATASDPMRRDILRSAYVEILRQIEPLDARILDFVHQRTRTQSKDVVVVHDVEACKQLGITESILRESLDNLLRLRLLASYIEEHDAVVEIDEDPTDTWTETVSYDHQYSAFHFTKFGLNFMRSCTPEQIG